MTRFAFTLSLVKTAKEEIRWAMSDRRKWAANLSRVIQLKWHTNKTSVICSANLVRDSPRTVRVAFADRLPAAFWAVQLYTPMSSVFTLAMKKMSSSGITCILRSRAAGKSVPPSFCQAIWGDGWPSAAHSSLAIVPVRIVRSMGVLRKDGSSKR